MMKDLRLIPIALLLLVSLVPSVRGQGCTEEQDKFCAEQANRICAVREDNGKSECAECLSSAVEFQSGCIPLEKIELFAYLEEFQVDYRTSIPREERWDILQQSMLFIADFQANNPNRTYELGLTPASADNGEDLKHRSGFRPELFASNDTASEAFQVFSFNASQPSPSKVDWISAGAVAPVKDQGRCASSWAIATAGAIEGAAVASGSFLQSLSWQQFISCDPNNLGCEGGSIAYATAYAIGYGGSNPAGGIASLADYPYTDSPGVTTTKCSAKKQDVAVEVASGNIVFPYNSLLSIEKRIDTMKQQLAIQPVAVAIKSGCPTFANYVSGVLTDDGDCACTDNLCADHAVLLIGYNDDAEVPYWTIKNSWSTSWGESGYARIAQDPKEPFGLFGIMTLGVVPEVRYNPTVKLSEGEPLGADDGVLEWWHILLICIGSVFVLCCLVCCISNQLAPSPEEQK